MGIVVRTAQRCSLVVAAVVWVVGLAACDRNDSDVVSTAKPPIDGYHYNGTTDQDLPMTFSTFGMTVPLFEAAFVCEGDVVAKTSLEVLKIEQSGDGYSFKVSANSLVGYSDEAPDENGTIAVSGSFAGDAQSSSGDFRIETSRCASGEITWDATAEPERVIRPSEYSSG